MDQLKGIVIGGGVTGLSVGAASGFMVLEAEDAPGGICSSYYIIAGDKRRLPRRPSTPCYQFELGGGHWIFGGDPIVLSLIKSLVKVREYQRRSSVYFRSRRLYVPYPLQDNLVYLDNQTMERALTEMDQCRAFGSTMKEWLLDSFGPTLCELFFFPFHERYVGALYDRIAPQDAYKNPRPRRVTANPKTQQTQGSGYNVTYLYPEEGLDTLMHKMAAECNVRYRSRVTAIEINRRQLTLDDGATIPYDILISTLPLSTTLLMTGLETVVVTDPYTSVLVLNVGAIRGPSCPDDHWIYTADSRTPFHRVGFYSNVDASFAPVDTPAGRQRVGLYIERTFEGGKRPTPAEVDSFSHDAVTELQEWGFIREVEVLDPTWIEVAYTWSWPGSKWRKEAMELLESHGIYPVGRYGRWVFQGIADSIKDGLFVGSAAGLSSGLTHRL